MSDHRAAYGLAADFDPFERIEADTLALAAAADGRPPRWTTYVGCNPATPSNPRRRFRDIVTVLRANSLQWPPASKKEQRAQRRRDVQ